MQRYLFCLFFLFSFAVHAKPIIIFDAGSSGTRIHVYDIALGKDAALHSYKIKPGLSSLDPSDTQALDQYFNTLVQSTENILDAQTRAQTQMFLYATAGVRMLPAAQQTQLLEATRQSLNHQAQLFGYPEPEEVRAISGTEEAAFIWMADNYLLGNLNQYSANQKTTVVAVEMGGASSEIAFVSPIAKKHTLSIENNDQTVPIYGYAYDGLGADKAIAKMQYQKGFENCFPLDAPYPLDTAEFIGTGDFNACVDAVKLAFNAHDTVPPFNKLGAYQPPAIYTHQYVLTSAFYYLFDTLGLANEYVSYNTFLNTAENFCALSWEAVQEIDQSPNNLIHYCFNAALTQTLFDAWYVRKNDQLMAVSEIGGTPVEWPLGAVVYHQL